MVEERRPIAIKGCRTIWAEVCVRDKSSDIVADSDTRRWTIVASCVGTRSADRQLLAWVSCSVTDQVAECAKRWQQSLNPELDRSEWREADVSHTRES
jgi:hypothetical protein